MTKIAWHSAHWLDEDICICQKKNLFSKHFISKTSFMQCFVFFLGAWKTWSQTSHPLRRGLPMVSCRSCWNGWKLPRSSSPILVLWSKDEEADTVTCGRSVLASGNTTLSYFAICFTEAVVSSGRVEKSPHEQEIKFFAKVRPSFETNVDLCSFEDLSWLLYCKTSTSLKSLSPDLDASHQPVFQKPLPLLSVNTCKGSGQWWPFFQ